MCTHLTAFDLIGATQFSWNAAADKVRTIPITDGMLLVDDHGEFYIAVRSTKYICSLCHGAGYCNVKKQIFCDSHRLKRIDPEKVEGE